MIKMNIVTICTEGIPLHYQAACLPSTSWGNRLLICSFCITLSGRKAFPPHSPDHGFLFYQTVEILTVLLSGSQQKPIIWERSTGKLQSRVFQCLHITQWNHTFSAVLIIFWWYLTEPNGIIFFFIGNISNKTQVGSSYTILRHTDSATNYFLDSSDFQKLSKNQKSPVLAFERFFQLNNEFSFLLLKFLSQTVAFKWSSDCCRKGGIHS